MITHEISDELYGEIISAKLPQKVSDAIILQGKKLMDIAATYTIPDFLKNSLVDEILLKDARNRYYCLVRFCYLIGIPSTAAVLIELLLYSETNNRMASLLGYNNNHEHEGNINSIVYTGLELMKNISEVIRIDIN